MTRRRTPADGERRPDRLFVVPALDTGGAYRPKHRPQDPAKDPHEPYGSESSATGSDHGWAGCTMSSAADALAYATEGRLVPWGGDMRHHQSDLSGGTDLFDAAEAFAEYGEELTVKSGQGWTAVVKAHDAGRAIIMQGTGQVPGSADFDGGHACCIGPETHADGRWLFGDPLCSDWQWAKPGEIKAWAERWQSSIAFAVTAAPAAPTPAPDEPEPETKTVYVCTPGELDRAAGAAVAARDDELVIAAIEWLRAPSPGPADRWDAGVWADLIDDLIIELDEGTEPDPCEPDAPGRWSRGPLPYPMANATRALLEPAAWDGGLWPGPLWRE